MTHASLIYLVDDDPSARRGLVRLFRTAGYDVQAYATANEFLEKYDPEIFGCLILDARLPGLSGEDLGNELNKRDVHLPLIFVTADDDPETRKTAKRLKAVGFFRKPVDGTALLDTIKWALEKEDRNRD
jgi:FixJ family two-component response regulator